MAAPTPSFELPADWLDTIGQAFVDDLPGDVLANQAAFVLGARTAAKALEAQYAEAVTPGAWDEYLAGLSGLLDSGLIPQAASARATLNPGPGGLFTGGRRA
jgi:hypothetical protein